MIVIGTDTHKSSHALAAVDEGTGRVRGHREIKADDSGHLAAVKWARGLDDERVWAIEDCRHVSRRLEQALVAAGERVVRVAPHRMGASRRGEREPGKSDEIDSLAVARAVVKDGVEKFPSAYLDEHAMEIRLLADHRTDLVVERTRIQNRLRWHLVALCPELERSLRRGSLADPHQLDRIDRRLRRMEACARVRVAREQVQQLRSLTRQVNTLRDELLALIKAHRPQLLAETGCGPLTAAILIGRTAGAERFASDASFALLVRNRTDQMLLGAANQAPAQPWRRPPTQPRAAHHRDHPRPTRPRHPSIPRPQTSRRQNHQRRPAMPQATPRQTFPPPPLTPSQQPSPRPRERRPRAPRDTPTRGRPHRRRCPHTHAMHQMKNPATSAHHLT